jgi:DNA primase
MNLLAGAFAPLNAHYARVAPLLESTLGPIPFVCASFPDGLGTTAHYFRRQFPLTPRTMGWCVEHIDAIEFYSWTPSPDHHDRLGYARILLETAGSPNATAVREAARLTRTELNALDLDAIAVLDGVDGMALFLPFDDAPEYTPVRTWLHQFANGLAVKYPDLFSTEPNTHGDTLIHIHVQHNAIRASSALPYTARARAGFPVALPIAWTELALVENGSVTVESLSGRIAKHGNVLATERIRIGRQDFAIVAGAGGTSVIPSLSKDELMPIHTTGHTIAAAMNILADGVTRSAEQIFEEAVKDGLLPAAYKARYVYTALIEYIARANGNGRKPYIVQDEQRNFRINEPPDDWPNLAPPAPRPPDPQAQALAARLTVTSTGSDSTAFEVAVCDAFAHLGFASTHLGGHKASDGYADALLGPLGYRVMLECKTAKETVTNLNTFEAAKYRDAFRAQYCALVGPAFPNATELTQELQTHGVSAWTVDDLNTALLCGANAHELRPCFEPGYAADGIMDFLWSRDHGPSKRVRVAAELICQVGLELQTTAAREGTPADAPLLTSDTAMALVDQALAAQGSSQGCTRDEITLAFDYLTNPIVARAVWTFESKAAIALVGKSSS